MARLWLLVVGLCVALSTAAVAADFSSGQIVRVRRFGKLEEVRVVRHDQYGVLVQYKDWQDGTFHDDMAIAPTAYYNAAELNPAPPAPAVERAPASAPDPAPVRAQNPAEEAPAVAAGALQEGEYLCYTYHPSPVVAGKFTITGDSYRTPGGAAGKYRIGDGGRIEWLGELPLGFAAAVLEETDPKAKIRMYPQAADIGNKWKAAVCLPKEDATAPAVPAAGGAFPPGAKVEMDFAGYWYAASVIRCSAARCLLHYDDPKWKDEWVDTTRIRNR